MAGGRKRAQNNAAVNRTLNFDEINHGNGKQIKKAKTGQGKQTTSLRKLGKQKTKRTKRKLKQSGLCSKKKIMKSLWK